MEKMTLPAREVVTKFDEVIFRIGIIWLMISIDNGGYFRVIFAFNYSFF